MAFAIVLVILRRRSANARYLAGCVALVMMAALPLVIFLGTAPPGRSQVTESAETVGRPASVEPAALPLGADEPRPVTAGADHPIQAAADAPLLARATQAVEPALPWVVLTWAAGVFLLSVWQFAGWLAAGRLRRMATQPAEPDVVGTVVRLAHAMRVSRPVKVLVSTLVRVPTVVGWLRPVILIPAGLATGLAPQQLQAVLAHELAHIRRYDYLVNLLQSLVETLLFYHPAVWFISRRIRAERENCCDDVAVAAGAEPLSYAESLVRVARRSAAPAGRGRPAVAAGLGVTGRPSQLGGRIRRLLGAGREETSRFSRGWPIALAFLGAVLAGTCLLMNADAGTPGKTDKAGPPGATGAGPKGASTQPARKGDTIAWGREVKGLRLGLSLDLGRRAYHPGDALSFRLHVRNVSDGEIVLAHSGTQWSVPQVRDASGKLVPVAAPPIGGPVRTHFISLRPQESHPFGYTRLQIVRQPKERPTRGDVALKPGSYRVSQTFRFRRDTDGKATWAGELTSAEVALRVEIDDEPRKNAEAFLGAALAGDEQTAAKLAEPRSAVARQLGDFSQLAGRKELRIISVYADEADALAVTSEVSDDRDRKGQLLLRLQKRRGNWKVIDIDFEAGAQAPKDVKAFREAHPGAVAIPPATQPAAKGDGLAWGKAVGGVQVGIGLVDPSKSSYRIGQDAGFYCHARNVTGKTIKLSLLETGARAWHPHVGNGKISLPGLAIVNGRVVSLRTLSLPPGKAVPITTAWFLIIEPDWVGETRKALLRVRPGKYAVTFSLLAEAPAGDGHSHSRSKARELVSGELALEIVPASAEELRKLAEKYPSPKVAATKAAQRFLTAVRNSDEKALDELTLKLGGKVEQMRQEWKKRAAEIRRAYAAAPQRLTEIRALVGLPESTPMFGTAAARIDGAKGPNDRYLWLLLERSPSGWRVRHAADSDPNVPLKQTLLNHLRAPAGAPATQPSGTPPKGASTQPARKVGTIAWGREVNGLQLGLSLDLGLRQRPYHPGEKMRFRLHVRNVSDGEIVLAHHGTQWSLPQVRDASGELVRVVAPPIRGRPVRTHFISLKPRESRSVGDMYVQTVRRLKERPSRGDVVLKPGSYRVSKTFHFRRDPDGKATWAGELTSGEVPLTMEIDDRPRRTAEVFLRAALAGDDQTAAKLTEPRSAVARQLGDFRQLAGQELRIISVHADEADALAVTSEVSDDRSRKGQLLLRLQKRRGNWKVIDIDFKAGARAPKDIKEFREGHPYAVAIPPAAPPGKATFGPVMERLVNDDGEGKDCLIDLDTGRLYSPPRHVKGKDKIAAWFRENGIDAGAETSPAGAGLFGLEMVVIPVASKLWDEDPLIGIRDELERGKPGTPAVMSALGSLPRTYVFKTREGGIGVLQVLVVRNDVRPRHIKIRYKMLKAARPRAPAALPASKEVHVPDADTKGARPVLDLASGEMLPVGKEDQFGHFGKLGKGDLAYDRVLICLRGATARTQKAGKVVDLKVVEKRGDTTAYELPRPGSRLLVRVAGGKQFEVELVSRGIQMEYEPLGGPTKGHLGRKVHIHDADTKGVKAVLDLASGEMLPVGKDDQFGHFTKLGKGDLAYDRALICLRGATAKSATGKALKILQKRGDMTAYEIPQVPLGLVVSTADGRRYRIGVLSRGVLVRYKKL